MVNCGLTSTSDLPLFRPDGRDSSNKEMTVPTKDDILDTRLAAFPTGFLLLHCADALFGKTKGLARRPRFKT